MKLPRKETVGPLIRIKQTTKTSLQCNLLPIARHVLALDVM